MAAFAWIEPDVVGLEARLNAIAAARGPLRPVVFYGSSSVRLWETLAHDFGHSDIVNAGFGGSSLEACAHFFERLIVPLQPRSLVVYAGDNDLGDGGASDIDVYRSYLELVRKLDWHLPTCRLTFLSIKPSPSRWGLRDRIRRVNDMIATHIATRPNSRFVDIFTPMLDWNGLPARQYFVDDLLHLSPKGYQLWTQVLGHHLDHIFAPPLTSPLPPAR
jgi:lysophospholipase L1-like esterase